MSTSSAIIYRIIFRQENHVYELYSRYVSEESLMGFIEMDELLVADNASTDKVDVSSAQIKEEFTGVHRFYLPVGAIIRIDEVTRANVPGLTSLKTSTMGQVSPFQRSGRNKDES